MYLNIILFPFFGFFFGGFFGKFLGPFGSSFVTTFCIFCSCFFSYFAFFEICIAGCPCFLRIISWIEFDLFFSCWGFFFDTLTVIMLVVVSSISFLVHFYSIEYMSHDPHISRFLSYLSLFTFFMFVLISADNFLQMFLGWEGIGLCSYLLINFWFSRIQANKSAIKAVLFNRFGDFALALSIFLQNFFFESLEYSSIFAMAPFFVEKNFLFFSITFNFLNSIGFLLFFAAVGKSSQIGLHCWLPDAMEGPTPVSALIHAATLVTAGVFLLARCSPIIEFTYNILGLICFFGAVTSFFSCTTGMLQNDLKKVIAYSTCSQLGYMIFACGLSNYSLGIFHLANHAFFKALLFLSAGSVIHGIFNEQDMRKMGGLQKIFPVTYAMIFIGSFSLLGFPFLTGFYSKDLILEVAFGKFTNSGHFAFWFGSLSVFFTAYYSVRLLFLTFLSERNGFKPLLKNVKDSTFFICAPLIILSFPSIFFGFFFKDMMIGLGTDFWSNSIFIHPKNLNLFESEVIPFFFKFFPIFLSFVAVFLSFFLYSSRNGFFYFFKTSPFGKFLYSFLNRKWLFDKIYNEFITQYFFYFSYFICYKIIDKGLIEFFGPFGISSFVLKKIVRTFLLLQTGKPYHYILFFFSSFFILLFFIGEFWSTILETVVLFFSLFLLIERN